MVWQGIDDVGAAPQQESHNTGNHENSDVAVAVPDPRTLVPCHTAQNPENLNSVPEHHRGNKDGKDSKRDVEGGLDKGKNIVRSCARAAHHGCFGCFSTPPPPHPLLLLP